MRVSFSRNECWGGAPCDALRGVRLGRRLLLDEHAAYLSARMRGGPSLLTEELGVTKINVSWCAEFDDGMWRPGAGEIHQVDEQTKRRVVSVAAQLVEGMVARGEIECTEDAIRAAVPQAVADAKAAVLAAEEFVCG